MIRDTAEVESKPVSESALGPCAPRPSSPRSLVCRAMHAR